MNPYNFVYIFLLNTHRPVLLSFFVSLSNRVPIYYAAVYWESFSKLVNHESLQCCMYSCWVQRFSLIIVSIHLQWRRHSWVLFLVLQQGTCSSFALCYGSMVGSSIWSSQGGLYSCTTVFPGNLMRKTSLMMILCCIILHNPEWKIS